jgi:6-phosphogluconolactonase/glucosamine-6-phosphate isomerase/deaminase
MRANLLDHVNIGQANCNFPNHAKLTDSTIGANQRFFEKRKGAPTCAYTMGISSILQLHSC